MFTTYRKREAKPNPEEKRKAALPADFPRGGHGFKKAKHVTLSLQDTYLRGSAYFKSFQHHINNSLTGQHIAANNRCGFCWVEHTSGRDYHLHWS